MKWNLLLAASVLAVAFPVRSPARDAGYPVVLSRGQVADLCMYVGDMLYGGQPGERRYAFDRAIRKWSGITGTDEVTGAMAAPIRTFWAANRAKLTCNQLSFTVRDGSLWKLAIERQSEDFLEMALIDWGLVPNDLDCTGETPLDFIEREHARAGQTGYARVLRRYRDLLLEYGAKHASELTSDERALAPVCR